MTLAIVQDSTPARRSFEQSWLAGQLSGETARAYASDIRQFVEVVGKDLCAVGRSDMMDYRRWLVERYKPATVNRKLSAVRQLFAEAVRHEVMDRSPADGLKGHRTEGNYSPTKSPSEEQVFALLDSVNGDDLLNVRDKAMLYVMLGMGLRRHEVAQLAVSSIAEDQGYPVLHVLGKGNKRRKVTIPDNVLSAVRRLIRDGALTGDAPLFQEVKRMGRRHRFSGKAISANGIYHVVRKRCEAVGIDGVSPHGFRHFLVTYLIEHGASIYDAQQVAGHADVKTTQRYVNRANNLASSAAKFVQF